MSSTVDLVVGVCEVKSADWFIDDDSCIGDDDADDVESPWPFGQVKYVDGDDDGVEENEAVDGKKETGDDEVTMYGFNKGDINL